MVPREHLAAMRRIVRDLHDRGIRAPFLAGAELTLAEFLEEDRRMNGLLLGRDPESAATRFPGALDLLWFLQSHGADERLFRAEGLLDRLCSPLWLSPEPFLRRLSGLEFGGAFYRGYRDHVVHTFLVYVLGGWLVRACRPLSDAVVGPGSPDDEAARLATFAAEWRTTALFHDIGYLFENDRHDERFEALALVRSYPKRLLARLRSCPNDACHALSEGDLAGIDSRLERKIALRDVFDLFRLREGVYASTDAFEVLAGGAEPMPPGLAPGGFRTYFDLCRLATPTGAAATDGRPPYLDHGVMGALVLLKLGEITKAFFDVATSALEDTDTFGGWPAWLAAQRRRFEAELERAVPAATAIAVHNIQPGIHRSRAYSVQDAARRVGADYQVRLGHSRLAFLLRLADTLQDWERRYFRSHLVEGRGLPRARSAQDIDLRATPDGGIAVTVSVDGPTEASRFAAAFSDLHLPNGEPLVPQPSRDSAAASPFAGAPWFVLEFETPVAPLEVWSEDAGDASLVADQIDEQARPVAEELGLSSPVEKALRGDLVCPPDAGYEDSAVRVDLTPVLLALLEEGWSRDEAVGRLRRIWSAAMERRPWGRWTWSAPE